MKKILTPYSTKFTKKRYGRNQDGGYVLLSELCKNTEFVYSYGAGDDTSFEEDVSKEESVKAIFLHDHTVNFSTENQKIFFKKEALSKDFASHLIQNGHDNKKEMLLKVDTEGAEWDTFLNCDEKVFEIFSQIVIEFHWMKEDDGYQKSVLEKLLKFYYIFHLHGNNYAGQKNGIPEVLEISFVKKSLIDNPEVEKSSFPVENLDYTNCSYRKDFVLDWWL